MNHIDTSIDIDAPATTGWAALTEFESFSGLLAGLLLRRYGADTEAGFRAINEALRARAEELAAAVEPRSVHEPAA